jgi:uncharacterized protein DUF3489
MSKPRANSRPRSKPASHRKPMPARSAPAPTTSGHRRGATKHDQVLALLRTKRGTTITALAKATGWQPHSVRGFLAGIVRKKLGLSLTSEKTDAGRVYRIVGTKPAPSRPEAKAELPHA